MAISRKSVTEFVLRITCEDAASGRKHQDIIDVLRAIADDLETGGGLKSNKIRHPYHNLQIGEAFFRNARRIIKGE